MAFLFMEVIFHALDDRLLIDEALLELQKLVLEALNLLLFRLKTGFHFLSPVGEHLLRQLKFLDLEFLGEEGLDLVPKLLLDLVLLLVQLRCFVLLLLQLSSPFLPLFLGTGICLLVHLALRLFTAGLHFDSLDILFDGGDDLIQFFNLFFVHLFQAIDFSKVVIILLRELLFVLHLDAVGLPLALVILILNLLQFILELVEKLLSGLLTHPLHLIDTLFVVSLFGVFLFAETILCLLLHVELLFVQIMQFFDVVIVSQIHCLHRLRIFVLELGFISLQCLVLVLERLELLLLFTIHLLDFLVSIVVGAL